MTSKYSSRSYGLSRLLILASLSMLMAVTQPAWAQKASQSEHFMSRSVRNISPEQAVEYITQTRLGTASRIPNTQTILVTAKAAELTKARTLLELVDSKEHYIIVLMPADQNVVSAIKQDKLSEHLTDLSLGSFTTLPAISEKPRVLIDIHDSSVIVAAPANQMEQVLSALEQASEPQRPAQPTDSNQPVAQKDESTGSTKAAGIEKLQNDHFFNQALESLMQAERAEAELRRTQLAKATELPGITPKPVATEPVTVTGQHVEQTPIVTPPESGRTKIIELGAKHIEPPIKKISYEPVASELADEQLELDLPETINITEIIDLVGKTLNLDLLYDPKEVTGQVTLRVQDKIKVGELYPLLESVLKFRGFAMSRKGNLVTIVPIAKVLETDPIFFDAEGKELRFGDVIVTRVYDLRYIDTTSAENLLKEMRLGAHIKGIAQARKLIVTGYAYRMNRVEELLTIIDRPGELKQFRYRQLRYTMAASLSSQVKTLAEQLGTISITVAAAPQPVPKTTRGRRTPARPAKPTPAPTAAQPTVYLDADERTNRILMIGMPEQLDIVETLIDSLDVAQQDLRTLRLYDIQYAGAEETLQKLQDMGIIGGPRKTTRTGRITAAPKGKPAEAAPALTILTEEGLVEEPQIVIIESTNSLLVNATAEQHAKIATIIAYVDAEPEQAALNYVVYPLENQDPEELAAVLNQLVKETIEETKGKDSKVVRTTTKSRIEEDITIIPEPTTYSLVVYASRKNQQWISSLIRELDEYRPQVLLDCTLVEITQDDSFTFALNLIGKTYGGRTLQDGSKLSTIGTSGTFGKSRLLDTLSTSGAITAFFNSSKIQAFLDTVESKGYGRVMARPKILVNDNQEGEIKTETRTSVAQISSDIRVPTQGDAITTTSVTFNEYTEGIVLKIKPHISKGNMLRLEITLNRTDFDEKDEVTITDSEGEKKFPSPPDLISTDITTVSTIPDGTTIILGGLESIDQRKSHSKTPILGDIPIIGGLFRGIDNKDTQSKLYIFVKAHIIRPGDQEGGMEDISRVSMKNRRAFEDMEEKFQNLQDWPGIKPKPMDPLKVLEED